MKRKVQETAFRSYFYLLCDPLFGEAVMEGRIDAAGGTVDKEKSNRLSYWTTYFSIDNRS